MTRATGIVRLFDTLSGARARRLRKLRRSRRLRDCWADQKRYAEMYATAMTAEERNRAVCLIRLADLKEVALWLY